MSVNQTTKLPGDAQLLLQHQKTLYDTSIKQQRKNSLITIIVLGVMLSIALYWLVNNYLKWQMEKTATTRAYELEIEKVNNRAHYIKNAIIGDYYIDDKKKFEDFMLTGSWIITKKYHEYKKKIKSNKFASMNNKEIRKYLEISFKGAQLVGIDPYLLLAVDSVESEYDKKAKSKAGALGICQFMPLTAKLIANSSTNYTILQVDGYEPKRLYDPVYSKKLQIRFLHDLFVYFDGRVEWVLLAYNWGPDVTAKKKWADGDAVFSDLDKEQQEYATKVLNVYNQLKMGVKN